MRKINELGLKMTYEMNHVLTLSLKVLRLKKKENIGASYDMIVQVI